VSKLKRIPSVVTCHAEAFRHRDVAMYVRLEAPVLRRLHRAVAVSEPIARELRARGISADRIRVIANGIADPRNGTGSSDGRQPDRLLVVGRLVDGKNVDLLIDVVAQLRAVHSTVELVVAGDGPLRDALEERARRAGIATAVTFRGFVSNLADEYASASVFVLPSRTEGMPMSLLEAMSHALPIVATSVGSIPKVVRDNVEAFLIPPDDAPALYGALRRMLDDAPLRTALGSRARARFEEAYTADVMADAYAALYAELWGRRVTRLRATA
jgi:glycosyltransferase involved in cell wall biosynthesis